MFTYIAVVIIDQWKSYCLTHLDRAGNSECHVDFHISCLACLEARQLVQAISFYFDEEVDLDVDFSYGTVLMWYSRHYNLVVLLQTQASIRPTKAKAIRERNVHLVLLGNLRDVITIELFRRVTRIIQIERRWHYTLRSFSSVKSNLINILL
jgi:hypothetical protein